jgi:hypothetical protein
MRIPREFGALPRYALGHWSWLRRWEAERKLRQFYKELHDKELDLGNLATFSEKLFGRMIAVSRNGNAIYTRLTDKYLARDYVRQKIGEEYLVNLIWHGANPREIPFERLSKRCVIKTSHGSAWNVLASDGNDRNEVIGRLSAWLNQNYYWTGREYQYFRITPRVLIEEYIDDGELGGPLDYRFWCFDGVPAVIQVDDHAHSINPFYDTSWTKLDLRYRKEFRDCDIKKPRKLDAMLKVAFELAKDFDFVRVDLYNIRGRTLFGEMSFTPMGGRFKFHPESWDSVLGRKWVVRSKQG